MREKYCLLHPGRCGSTVIAEMITASKEILWLNEAFTLLIEHHRGNASHSFIQEDVNLRNLVDSGRFIEGLNHQLSKALLTCEKVGFELKIHRNQELILPQTGMMAGDSLDVLINLGVSKFIFLRRDNLLRCLISAARAFDSGIWHLKKGESPSSCPGSNKKYYEFPLKKLIYGPNRLGLIDTLNQMQSDVLSMEQALVDRNIPYLDLRYSIDVLPDPQIALTKISQYLSINIKSKKPTLRRTNPRPLKDFIVNIKDLEKEIEGSSFSWMLSDPKEESYL